MESVASSHVLGVGEGSVRVALRKLFLVCYKPPGTGRASGTGGLGERALLGFREGASMGAHPVPSSCTRHMSLCSSEKESWISIVGYTMEVLVCVQTCGSFQNPGWTVGWNSGGKKRVEGGPQAQWAVRCLTAPLVPVAQSPGPG